MVGFFKPSIQIVISIKRTSSPYVHLKLCIVVSVGKINNFNSSDEFKFHCPLRFKLYVYVQTKFLAINNFIEFQNKCPHSTEYCTKMAKKFLIFHCNGNSVAIFLSNIEKYFIATLQLQLYKILLKKNKYLILLEIFSKDSIEMCRSYILQ